jgi:type II secretory pathway component PulF
VAVVVAETVDQVGAVMVKHLAVDNEVKQYLAVYPRVVISFLIMVVGLAASFVVVAVVKVQDY